ncbi:MAG: Response regulator receiver domain [Paenibacillus sp.]|nr:Response regulator receiver domain [Paenibacillus sp.]
MFSLHQHLAIHVMKEAQMTANILLVEDDPDIRELVALYLHREGFSVELAANAEEGLERFRSSPCDAIILCCGGEAILR